MLSGVAYIHEKGICNRGFKLENIFVGADYKTIKIADFAFSARTEGSNNDGLLSTKIGTLGYMAPELLE